MPRILILALLVLTAHPLHARDRESVFLKDGQRVLFLGGSNTYAGLYITYLDGYLCTRLPDQQFELLNLGLPSETACGLSEPDHPFPRPNVHDRLEAALTKTKPDVVVACYGINDGIYHPFSEERFQTFQKGVRRLIAEVEKAGAKIVLVTPMPFDPRPIKTKVQPSTGERFSWLKPYEDYDEVLDRYSAWLVSLRAKGYLVVDGHQAIKEHLQRIRKDQPEYFLSGDGIHPLPMGHWLMSQEILRAWKVPSEVDRAEIEAAGGKVLAGEVKEWKEEDGRATFLWQTRVPMPTDPRWDARIADREQVRQRWNTLLLKVKGLKAAEGYDLYEGDTLLGRFTPKQLAEGIDLSGQAKFSPNQRSSEVGKLVAERQELLRQAWLSEVGHKRPGIPAGLPLEDAQRKARELTERIRDRAKPVQVRMTLVPATR